jgi:hypothetical protein
VLSSVLVSCGGGNGGPPATPTTPVLRGVTIAGQAADISQMPIQASSSQYFVITVAAPAPADLRVAMVPPGPNIERVVSSPARERQLADAGTPFFVVDDLDVNQNPAVWRVRVSPSPAQQCAMAPFVIAIRHVVSNTESAPLNVGFAHAESFRVIGTSGRVVSLTKPNCTAIDELRLDRRSGGAQFTPIATFPRGAPATFYRDTGLTPSTPFDYRLTFVRFVSAGPTPTKNDVESVTASATTTALLSGVEQVSASPPDAMVDAHLWRVSTFDPLVRGGVTVAVNAVITRVQNDGNRDIVMTFTDKNNARVSMQTVAANSSVTSPFAGMLVEGAWDPIRTTGSAVGLPSTWPFRVFWQEP